MMNIHKKIWICLVCICSIQLVNAQKSNAIDADLDKRLRFSVNAEVGINKFQRRIAGGYLYDIEAKHYYGVSGQATYRVYGAISVFGEIGLSRKHYSGYTQGELQFSLVNSPPSMDYFVFADIEKSKGAATAVHFSPGLVWKQDRVEIQIGIVWSNFIHESRSVTTYEATPNFSSPILFEQSLASTRAHDIFRREWTKAFRFKIKRRVSEKIAITVNAFIPGDFIQTNSLASREVMLNDGSTFLVGSEYENRSLGFGVEYYLN